MNTMHNHLNIIAGITLAAVTGIVAGGGAFAQMPGVIQTAGDAVLYPGRAISMVQAGHNVSGENCIVRGRLMAGHNVSLSGCQPVGDVMAGHDADIRHTQVLGDIKAGGLVRLRQAHVDGSVMIGGRANIAASTVGGSLYYGGERLVLHGSRVGGVRFEDGGSHGNSSFVASGSSIVSVSGGSVSMVNGYTVRSSNRETTVLTPENYLYINGRLESGSGPETYSGYRQIHAGAPMVQGPGWIPGGGETGNEPAAVRTLELVDTVVEGDVRFEGGGGIVLLRGDSRVAGRVIGGKIHR